MIKNLKKVISAVAALAISASAVSALAVNFPDVAEDASYATAVQELSSLDIISGFDDGTFRPDELVTRAQMAKMVVDALNEREQAEASKANSQFTDVAADHWAKGYINQGVSDKFIAGYSATEFGPEDNVTYVQAQKMLVCAIGYETYAQGSGGWPNGYKQWAASQGITDGISGIADDTQLTRAQVAQLIDNAMDAPVCVIDSWEPQWNGTQTPVLKIKNTHDDDDATDYQTLFTLKHDAYKFFGRVQNTNRTDNGLDTDEVEFSVEKSDNFDDEYVSTKYPHENITAKVGTTNAADYLLTYAEVLVQKDSNDEFTVLSISAAAATSGKVITAEAEDFDIDRTESNAPNKDLAQATKLYFGKNVKYTIDPDYEDYAVYVNGVKDDALTASVEALANYIDQHDTAAVVLEKQAKTGSTNTTSDYTLITITNYEPALVSEVVAKTDKVTINFDVQSDNIKKASKLVVDLEDENKTYSFKLDDAEIDPSEIQEDDVLSIAWNQTGDFADSDYYDVIVSRDTLEGVSCTSVGGDPTEWTLDGTKYRAASGFDDNDFADVQASSSTYNAWLDHFGRLVKVEEDSSTKNIAILKNVYQKRGGDWVAQIVTKNGAEEEHKVKDKAEADNLSKVLVNAAGANLTAADVDGVNYDGDKATRYVQQVIEYKLNSKDEISLKNNLSKSADTKTSDGTVAALKEAAYKASTERIGKIDVNANATILDLSDLDSKDTMKNVSASSFKDGVNYTAVGYDPTTSGDVYPRFIIVTKGGNIFGYDSQFAVVKSTSSVTVDGTDCVALELFTNGEDDTVTYTVSDDATVQYFKAGNDGKYAAANFDEADLKEGDIIVYTLDNDNYITDLRLINDAVDSVANYKADFESFEADVAKGDTFIPGDKMDWTTLFEDADSDDVKVIFGAVVNKKGSKVVISPVTKDANGVWADYNEEAYNYSDAKIYAYDFAASTKNGASKVTPNYGIAVTPDVKAAKDDDKTKINLAHDEVAGDGVYAIARVDGTKILEMVLFVNED